MHQIFISGQHWSKLARFMGQVRPLRLSGWFFTGFFMKTASSSMDFEITRIGSSLIFEVFK